MAKRSANQPRDIWIVAIALFRLVKAAGLILVGVGLLRLLHRDVASTVTHWVEMVRLDPDNRYIHAALTRVFRVTPAQLKGLSAGTFLYAALFITEGVGLLKRKHWAEYLTIISTALFIPLEGYEIYERFTWVRVAFLVVNIAIVWYLVARVKRRGR